MPPWLRPFKKTVMYLIKLSLIVATVGLFVLCFKGFYETPELLFKDNYVIGGVYLIVLLTLSASYGCFSVGVLRLRELTYSYLLALSLTNLTSWAQLSLTYHYFVVPWPLVFLTALQSLVAAGVYWLANRVYFGLSSPRGALAVVTDLEEDRELIEIFYREPWRYRIERILQEREGLEAIKAAAAPLPQVILCRCSPAVQEELMSFCFEEGKRLYLVPTLQDLLLHEAQLCHIGDSPVLLNRNSPMTRETRLIKRVLDLVIAGSALVALSPLMALIALAVKLQDHGPVLYRQTRLTQGGREFQLLKFRSMVPGSDEEGPRLVAKGDSRVTPVGRWLRRTRMDELPQLVNIIRGDMSIVGPRPERPEIAQETCKSFPQFRYRLKVQAGLTGYAQVYGRYDTPLEEKIKMDLLYIQRFSLATDLFLMVATLKVLFMGAKAEGTLVVASEGQDSGASAAKLGGTP